MSNRPEKRKLGRVTIKTDEGYATLGVINEVRWPDGDPQYEFSMALKDGDTWYNGKTVTLESRDGQQTTVELPRFGAKVYFENGVLSNRIEDDVPF